MNTFFFHHYIPSLFFIPPTQYNLFILNFPGRFVYTEQISFSSTEDASELCYTANKYMLPQLLKICLEYLGNNLSPGNACHVYEVAKLMDYCTLENKSLKVIIFFMIFNNIIFLNVETTFNILFHLDQTFINN
jgi:hypothetical protein